MFRFATLCLLGIVSQSSAKVYFKEDFSNGAENWVSSDWKQSSGQAGTFEVSAGDFYGDAEEGKGYKTTQDARFYASSAKFTEEIDNTDKDFIVQLSVKHEQNIDCGGGYVKLFPSTLDQATMEGESEYNIMFGPDICGTGTKKVHVIFNYKGENHLIKKDIRCESDQLTHVYTLIVHPDQTYEVRIDGEKKESGSLLEDWDFLPAKEIKDPEQSKPEDWVDEAMIDDPEDEKPAGWDDIAKQIADPEAEKPEDWDDEADGEWEPPMLDNPEYKGEWKAKRISNPEYKGVWEHPMIPNPEYKEDESIGKFTNTGVVGIDIWQVKSGTIFDNIIVTDDIAEAEAFMAETFGKNKDAEKEMFDEIQAKKREEEDKRRAAEEEARKAEEEEEDDDEDEDDSDDDDDDDEDDIDDKIKRAKDEL